MIPDLFIFPHGENSKTGRLTSLQFFRLWGERTKKHHQLCLSSGREHKAGFLLQGEVNGALSTRNTTYCVVKSQQLCSVGLDAALADLDSTADGEERNQWESGERGFILP